MSGFVLNIFPPGSLDSSVVTTVWIGILVLAFFNLRLGWVASGFIVPGYLVPLIILKPWSAGVIVVEGIATYGLVWLSSEQFSRLRLWNNFFGRDRFFAILLASVIVRVFFDGWFLPLLGEHLNSTYHLAFDYRNNLHSFGLVIIALIANHFWKPGLVRGMVPFAVTVFVTWFIVRFGLMEFTNFTISSIGYMYEDLASNILASPKAYIILLTTAYIASRWNLRYGWEFSGILIPSLVTLLWYSPARIATTFLEAVVVSLLALLILRLPVFGTFTMEGTRRLVFYFTISYAYKFALSYALIRLAPEYKVSDAYGFGYLLPTLLAMKMPEIESYGKTIRVTLQTSVTAIALATVIGFGLTLVPDLLPGRAALSGNDQAAIALAPDVRLLDRLRSDKLVIYRSRLPGVLAAPLPRDMDIFSRALQLLVESIETGDGTRRQEAARLLAQVGYGMTLLEDRYLYLSEAKVNHGWGIYVLDTRARGTFLVEVPAPLNEQGSLEAGAAIFVSSGARALAIAGYDESSEKGTVPELSRSAATMFHAFHRAVARRDVLQVRAYTPASVRAIAGVRADAGSITPRQPESSLWVKSALPPGLNLAWLRESLNSLRIRWGAAPFPNVQRDATVSGFAELHLNGDDLRRVIFKPLLASHKAERREQRERIAGYLQDWILRSKGEIAGPGSNLYMPPKMEELLLFDTEVLTPLIGIARGEGSKGGERLDMEALRPIQAAATLFGYSVIVYHHIPTGQDFFIIAEQRGNGGRRYWGTYVLRIGRAHHYVIQVPRPLFEVNSFEYGVNLFERLNARALLIGGAHPAANRDGSANLVSAANKESLFNLVSQGVLRESPERIMVIQSRAFGLDHDRVAPGAGALVAFSNGAITDAAVPDAGRRLMEVLGQDRLSPRFVDGARDVVGYEVGATSQSLYLNQSLGKEFAILWLSPTARATYRQQTENRRLDAQFRSLDITTTEQDLFSVLGSTRRTSLSQLPPELRSRILSYLASQDVVILHAIKGGWPGCRLSRIIDTNTKQAFLLVSTADGRLSAVANLNPRRPLQTLALPAGGAGRDAIDSFIDARTALLEFGDRR